jgi:hypothetical protein
MFDEGATMPRDAQGVQMTQSIRIARTASIAALVLLPGGVVSAQRGSRGTMGTPRVGPPVSAPAPSPSPTGRGVMTVPRYQNPAAGPMRPRGGNLPRIVTRQGSGYIRGSRLGSGYNTGSSFGGGAGFHSGSTFDGFGHRFEPGASRRWRPGYTRPGFGANCFGGCFSITIGGRTSRFFSSFRYGYPFAIPIFVPFAYGTTYGYVEEPVAEYGPEPEVGRASSKLIVVGGGTGGGGDALTIETLGDSVRLSWLAAGRTAREVKLFVADSAKRELATRSASAAAPTATFEVSTLSAPVAFAGVTVTFADGVTTTTMVPYRGSGQVTRPR